MLTKKHRQFPWRIFSRVVFIQSALVLVALGASGLAARYFYKRQFFNQIESKLHGALTLVERALPNEIGESWCRTYAKNTEFHFSVVAQDGRLLCDSDAAVRDGENYLDLPEVRDALKRGFGQSIRGTKLFGQQNLYETVFLTSRGLLVRGSVPLSDLSKTMRLFDTSFGLILGVFAIVLSGFAIWSGRKLVFPIGRLLIKTESVLSNTPAPLSSEDLKTESFGEWGDLESNIDDIRRDLQAKAQRLDIERVELATIMGAISDAILAVDPEGVPLFFNSRFELLFGGSDLRARSLRLWEVFRDPEILEAFNVALRDGKAGATRTISFDHTDGVRRYFSLSVSPLRRKEGQIYGAVGIFHDISELKSAEQMRIDFVANVSHELRTPLTAIKGYAETLIQDLKNGRVPEAEFLSIIVRNANRLMNLMEDLLDLSSIESTHILQKDDLSTEEITTRVLKQLEPAFTRKKQQVESVVLAQHVIADPNRLEQVLVNLLDNASKYTPEGGNIRLFWEARNDDVFLTVSDTGPGIPREYQSRLFERFYRVDKARSREQGGTGLGLAIVKHIMQRHEGTVTVESRPGHGATFVCRFPGK